jgi:hypothetical protein
LPGDSPQSPLASRFFLISMVDEHPFQFLFESFGRSSSAHADAVNRNAADALAKALFVPLDHPGRCILLKAPRAGHGKTHLLTRVQQQLGHTHEFVPLFALEGSKIDARSVLDDVLRRLVRPLPAAGGLCVLDLAVRRLFAEALQPLVRSGEVPCLDRERALAALRDRPVETFDFHHPLAVTAQWARENFEVLGPRLGLELSQRTGLVPRETGFWVEVLFRFAVAPIEQPGRAAALAHAALADIHGDGVATARLIALLGLLTLLGRVVLVADELEGFSADEGAALRFAAFVAALGQAVNRLDVIVSLNQDIWQTAFLPRLSGGLADRIAQITIDLDPLTHGEMVALLDSRAPGLGAQVLEHVNVGGPEQQYARGLLRAAGIAWMRALRERQVASETSVASPEPIEPVAASADLLAHEPPASPIPKEEVEPVSHHESEGDRAESQAEDLLAEADSPPMADSADPVDVQDPPSTDSSGPAISETSEERKSRTAVNQPDNAEANAIPESIMVSPFTEIAVAVQSGAPAQKEPDRVDDLLRQFRERYGRGSL